MRILAAQAISTGLTSANAGRTLRAGLLASLLWLGGMFPAWGAIFEMQLYRGMCEASAAAFIDETHFAVASDETNVLRLYTRPDDSVGTGLDLTGFTGFNKSDIEAAARIGDRVYWLSSHSLNSDGEDKPKRKVLFATRIASRNGAMTLEPVGSPAASLREPLLAAAGVSKTDLNIEGLAATPEGELLIGLRDTLNGRAIIVPFHNPAAVVDQKSAPQFGKPIELDLKGNGVRSLDRVADRYFIVAGPVSDAAGFALYSWSGPGTDPVPIEGVSFDDLHPEALMGVPGSKALQILSDDGSDDCQEDKTPENKKAFRSIDVEP